MKSLTKRFPVFQYLAMVTSTLNIVNSGMLYGWASPSLPQLLAPDSYIPMTSEEGSWIAVTVLFGAICGSILSSIILDKIGRKNVILFSSIPFLISWMMLAFAKSVPVIIAARFISGLGDGFIYCGIPTYLGEISDPEIRGFLGSAISVTWILGILLMNTIGSYLSITASALIASTLPALLLLTFSWMPETPYYLLMKGDREGARRSLQIFKRTDDVEVELNRISKAVEEQNAISGSIFDLFTVKSNRKALYIMMMTRGTQQLSGTCAIMFYAQIIFKEAGNTISPSIGSIIYFGIQLVLTGISSGIVDKLGRKPLLIISAIGAGLALLIEACYFYVQNSTDIDTTRFAIVPIVALIAYIVIFSLGLQTVPIILIGEIFPTNVKASAVGFADVYYSILASSTSKLFQIIMDEFGMHVPFFAFALACAVGSIFMVFYVPETKGKTLEEIQEELKGKRK